MVLSMTGYGYARRELHDVQITVELKSVNHRYAETNIRLPRQLFIYEEKIKKIILEYVHRGRVEAFISVEGETFVQKNVQVDWKLLDEIYQVLYKTREKYSIKENITLSDLFKSEEILTIVEKNSENNILESLLLETVQIAAEQLKQMRIQEGNKLKSGIITYLHQIKSNISKISEHAPQVSIHYREKLLKRINEFLKGYIDENRILTEVALFADKSDITEEITRIHSHISQLFATLQQDESVGRKLDFIVQELNREINTIGSKANDSLITQLVVEMKSNLEKIREQVQNIE